MTEGIFSVPENGSQEAVHFGAKNLFWYLWQGMLAHMDVEVALASLPHIRNTPTDEYCPCPSLPTTGRLLLFKQSWQISGR